MTESTPDSIEAEEGTEPLDSQEMEGFESTLTDVLGDFLDKFKPKDIKELVEQITKHLREKAIAEAQLKKHELILREAQLRARTKLITQFQWIRAVILVGTGIAATILILNGKFDSAPALFFGGLVAYLFGKEPK